MAGFARNFYSDPASSKVWLRSRLCRPAPVGTSGKGHHGAGSISFSVTSSADNKSRPPRRFAVGR